MLAADTSLSSRLQSNRLITGRPHVRNSSLLGRATVSGMIVAVGIVVYFASLLVRDVYWGIPTAVPVPSISARCAGDSSTPACEASVVALNPGRFRIAASLPSSTVTILVGNPAEVTAARFLLIRSAVPGRVVVGVEEARASPVGAAGDASNAGGRHVLRLPANAGEWDRIVFTPERSDRATVIEELGFFAADRGLLRSELQPVQAIPPQKFFFSYVALATIGVCVSLAIAGWFVPGRTLRTLGPWLVAILCLAIAVLDVGTNFSPYWGRDLRSFYASEWLPIGPDSNLTGGLYEGSRIVQGLGETVRPGVVQWHRMPGYGLFCAVGALVGRTSDVIEIAAMMVALQVLIYAIATGIFVFAAQAVFGPPIAFVLGILIAMLPKQLAYTQPDSIIVPIQLLVLAALLWHIAAERDERATFGPFLFVSLAFALWFFMRNDVLPGWFVVSAMLVRGRWRRLAVPLVLMLTIAVPWALYKASYRHEFDLLPTNTGEVLLLSLCEVPGAFPFACTDVGYVDWARRAGHVDSATSRASVHATIEVVRHWVTYPVHFGLMVLSKARSAITTQSFPGFQTRFNLPFGVGGNNRLFLVLLTVMAAGLAVNYRRRRTVLLGWAVFLNMPLFFVTFASGGRFYPAAGASLVVATVPLLCDAEYYKTLAHRPWRVAMVIACVTAFVVGAPRVEALIEAHESLHYWTPLLDPQQSTLKFNVR